MEILRILCIYYYIYIAVVWHHNWDIAHNIMRQFVKTATATNHSEWTFIYICLGCVTLFWWYYYGKDGNADGFDFLTLVFVGMYFFLSMCGFIESLVEVTIYLFICLFFIVFSLSIFYLSNKGKVVFCLIILFILNYMYFNNL